MTVVENGVHSPLEFREIRGTALDMLSSGWPGTEMPLQPLPGDRQADCRTRPPRLINNERSQRLEAQQSAYLAGLVIAEHSEDRDKRMFLAYLAC